MKTNNPKISVILPSFNVAQFIGECIDSVIKQTLRDIEIICVDGGSTDGTLDILEEYANMDSRIKLIHSEIKSYGYQMNLAINQANGEYIGIVETDDYIDEDMYERLYEESNNGSVDIVKSSFYHLHPNRTFPDTAKKNLPTGEFTVFDDPTILKSHPSIWAGIYRRSFLEENNITFMEAPGGGWVDNPFLFDTLFSAKSIRYIDEPFYYYREMNPNSSSNNIKDLSLSMRRMLNLFDILDKFDCEDESILATFYIRIFWHVQDLLNNHELGDQRFEVLSNINKVLKKMDSKIVKKYFGIKEQKIYFKYASPLSLIDTGVKNKNHSEDMQHLIEEHEFLYSSIAKSNENLDNNDLIEKRLNYSFKKLIQNNGLKNINIAYILIAFPVHSETFIINEVRWLKENNYNVTIFTNMDPTKSVEIDFDVDILRFNNIGELERLLITHEIDLMHTHFIYPICTNFTYPLAEKLKIPFTVFAHAFDIFIDINAKRNKAKEISRSKYCMGIFTLSNFHKNYLIKQGADKDKIIITKQATEYKVKPIKPKTNKIKNIISISRFVEKKGLDTLIDAAKLLENEDFEFSIYGFGEIEDALQAQIRDLKCNNISIKGELHPSEVITTIANADLLVSPCKVAKNGDMDGFPTVIFEAMAAGTPALATDVSAIPEIITDGENGFLTKQDNPQMLAEKIKEISKLPNEKLDVIRAKAQDDVTNISSVEKTMQKYIKTVEDWKFEE